MELMRQGRKASTATDNSRSITQEDVGPILMCLSKSPQFYLLLWHLLRILLCPWPENPPFLTWYQSLVHLVIQPTHCLVPSCLPATRHSASEITSLYISSFSLSDIQFFFFYLFDTLWVPASLAVTQLRVTARFHAVLATLVESCDRQNYQV